ncbi:MAG: four helix bundle protein [Terriglobia bacterium]
MRVFKETKTCPRDKRHSPASEMGRSSRSVAANIAEGFRKRQYPSMFVSKLADSDAEATETQVWLDFARDCGYLSTEHHKELVGRYEEVGRMLHAMIDHPERFVPSPQMAAWGCPPCESRRQWAGKRGARGRNLRPHTADVADGLSPLGIHGAA